MTERIYLDWNATAPLRPAARDAMLAALDQVGNPSSVHTEGRAARHLVEAARDLFASGRGAFLHVTLPLTMPGIVAAALLTFIPAIGDYVTPDLLGGAQTTTIAKIIQVLFTSGRDWPYGSALGFLLMVVTLGGTLLALRTLRREVIG